MPAGSNWPTGVRRHLAPGGAFVLTTVELDRDADDLVELALDVRGVSGAVYRMFESIDPDRAHRRITVLPPRPDPDRSDPDRSDTGRSDTVVCTSTIALLPADDLIAELAAQGFHLRRRRPVGGGPGRLRGTLIELAADR